MRLLRWKAMLSGTATATTTTTGISSNSNSSTGTNPTTAETPGARSSRHSFRHALATTVRRGAAAAAAAAAGPQRHFFPDDEAHEDTTSASSSASSPPFLPSPCPLTTERSPPAGADDGAAHNDDDNDDDGDNNDNDHDDRGGEGDAGWARLWCIHGRAYDLSGFMTQHPGGADALALARGRDCTALFESYHPFTDKPRQLLPKFLVPDAPIPAEVAGADDGFFVPAAVPGAPLVRDPFWEALRRECGAHLKEHRIATTMSWPFFLFGLAAMALQAAAYWWGFRHGSYPGAFALGLASWLVAGTFGHEGLHYGISRRHRWLNHALGFYATATMANPIIWKHQHTYGHHSFTNDPARDPDCHHFETMLRMHFANPHNALHRMLVHRLWVFVWWSQAMFGSVVLLPIKTLATGAIQGATSMRILSWRGRAGIVLHTVLVFWVFWILPYRTMRRAKLAALGLDDAAAAAAPLVMPYLVLRMCCLFTCFQTTLGAFFGVFTQCTHLTVESMAAAASAAASHRSWAKRQVETAANFASGSLLWFILSGGLNLQVEHHLFPCVSHGTLRHLTPIIRRLCQEHNVDFKSYPTFGDLLAAVLEYFGRLATEEQQSQGKAKAM